MAETSEQSCLQPFATQRVTEYKAGNLTIVSEFLAFWCSWEVPAGSIMQRSDACLTSTDGLYDGRNNLQLHA